MPIISVRNDRREWLDVPINRYADRDGKTPPLTLGTAAGRTDHIHVPGATATATVEGSSVSTAYALMIVGPTLIVNGLARHTLRALRHGDLVSVGGGEIRYLDFAVRVMQVDSKLAEQKCGATTCERPPLEPGDEYVICPWCSRGYHAGCWLTAERCAGQTRGCYPVRRMLLALLDDRITAGEMRDVPEPARRCASSGCQKINRFGQWELAPLIDVGERYVTCPNPNCRMLYHVHCFLSGRGECPGCGLDIGALVDRAIRCEPEEDAIR